MGLDAVVYRNIDSLGPELRGRVRVVDSITGELDFVEQGPPDPHYNDALFAADIRIGNVALVDRLREQIRSRWNGQCDALLTTVLHSGSHSGDFINLDGVEKIRREIRRIDLTDRSLPENLNRFFEAIRLLLDASEAEQNPIVFQ
jgi:hypothetical protein